MFNNCQWPIILYYHGNQSEFCKTKVIKKIADPYEPILKWYQLDDTISSLSNRASKSAFQVSMATDSEFSTSENFSALPIPSPSNRAVNEVSRPNGCHRRAFVTCALYYNHCNIIWICPSVCLLAIFSGVCGPIAAKLGRNVRDGTAQELRALVSMETESLPWYSTKTVLWL